MPTQERVSVVHGDYRIDNMIFHADRPEVAAVLDWELSTLGDPLADFTYFIMQWIMPHEGRSGLGGLDLAALGIPTLDEAVALYCGLTNRPGLPDLNWYFAYNLYRLACIAQGIAGRIRDGTAASARAIETASAGEAAGRTRARIREERGGVSARIPRPDDAARTPAKQSSRRMSARRSIHEAPR